jgi:peptidoglycan-N-acetylglucosamine deacetylase
LFVVRGRGQRSLVWSHLGQDWGAGRSPASIAAEVTEELEGGDVLLLHDADHYSEPGCWQGTVAALPAVIERIRARGLRPVAV